MLQIVAPDCVLVVEGAGAAPINGSYVGPAGFAAFLTAQQQFSRWDSFVPQNFIRVDETLFFVLGTAVGTVGNYVKATWRFTHIWAFHADGRLRSLEWQMRVLFSDSQLVYGQALQQQHGDASRATEEKKDKKDKKEKDKKKEDKEKEKKKEKK